MLVKKVYDPWKFYKSNTKTVFKIVPDKIIMKVLNVLHVKNGF